MKSINEVLKGNGNLCCALSILINGLKELGGYSILSQWDRELSIDNKCREEEKKCEELDLYLKLKEKYEEEL